MPSGKYKRKSAVSSSAITPRETPEGTPQPQVALIHSLDYLNTPLPFKNPNYANLKSKSRKTVKQILAQEQLRGAPIPVVNALASTSTDVAGEKKRGRKRKADVEAAAVKEEEEKERKRLEEEEQEARMEVDGVEGVEVEQQREVITYLTPLAPPSLLPAKKYCDITGLHANYTDPKTKLRYHGAEVWEVIRGLGPGQDQVYLALRGAAQTLM